MCSNLEQKLKKSDILRPMEINHKPWAFAAILLWLGMVGFGCSERAKPRHFSGKSSIAESKLNELLIRMGLAERRLLSESRLGNWDQLLDIQVLDPKSEDQDYFEIKLRNKLRVHSLVLALKASYKTSVYEFEPGGLKIMSSEKCNCPSKQLVEEIEIGQLDAGDSLVHHFKPSLEVDCTCKKTVFSLDLAASHKGEKKDHSSTRKVTRLGKPMMGSLSLSIAKIDFPAAEF